MKREHFNQKTNYNEEVIRQQALEISEVTGYLVRYRIVGNGKGILDPVPEIHVDKPTATRVSGEVLNVRNSSRKNRRRGN